MDGKWLPQLLIHSFFGPQKDQMAFHDVLIVQANTLRANQPLVVPFEIETPSDGFLWDEENGKFLGMAPATQSANETTSIDPKNLSDYEEITAPWSRRFAPYAFPPFALEDTVQRSA